MSKLDIATKCLHADTSSTADIACPLHVSTTYKLPREYNEHAASLKGYLPATDPLPDFHHYSRCTTEPRNRLEAVLGALEDGHAVTYSSGLAAVFALFQSIQPKTVVMSREGYHGTHGSIDIFKRQRQTKVLWIEDVDAKTLRDLDDAMIWLESPQNPRGEVVDVGYYASLINENVILAVDATFAPPPLQNLLSHGIECLIRCSCCDAFLNQIFRRPLGFIGWCFDDER